MPYSPNQMRCPCGRFVTPESQTGHVLAGKCRVIPADELELWMPEVRLPQPSDIDAHPSGRSKVNG